MAAKSFDRQLARETIDGAASGTDIGFWDSRVGTPALVYSYEILYPEAVLKRKSVGRQFG